MTEPQSGVLPDAKPHAVFLTLTLKEGEDAEVRCRQVIRGFPARCDEVAALDEEAELAAVAAIGAAAWKRLYPDGKPEGLDGFTAYADAGREAPSTPADLLLHIRGNRFDLCFELARRTREALADAVSVIEEIHGFRYLDSRDLTGFVDGTENPAGDEHRRAVAVIAEGPFAGGSFIDVQRYIHDLAKWQQLSVADQEQIIARTKEDNIEFEASEKPPTAHIKRVSIKEDGQSLEILRHSMPYGTANEHGLYFIAYAARPDAFSRMLEAMIVADEAGHYDHLMDYSRAVTGARFFAPSRDWLEGKGG